MLRLATKSAAEYFKQLMFNGAIEDDFVLTSSLFASRKFPVLVKEFPVPSL
jgi:hypothetical protein